MKIPEGWPTDVMIEVGANIISAAGRCDTWDEASETAKRIFISMSSHAPTPSAASRTEFERLIKAQTPTAQLIRADDGEYIVPVIQTMWTGYLMATPPAQEDEPVAEIVCEDLGRPFNAAQIRAHFYKEVPAVGTKLYTHAASNKLRKAAEQMLRFWESEEFHTNALFHYMGKLRAALEGKS